MLEYFSSTHGARKGLADTALKTADSGYLTRKLADVAQNVIVNEHDCGTIERHHQERDLQGRGGRRPAVGADRRPHAPATRSATRSPTRSSSRRTRSSRREIAAARGQARDGDLGLDSIRVRSPLTCESPRGVCARCYGVDLSTGQLVEEGLAVGIIAAQSIGEPGTQLTMRTFHTGGVATRAVVENEIATAPGRHGRATAT